MTHEAVGGVANGRFQIKVQSIGGVDIPLLETLHVLGLLGDALDPTVLDHLTLSALLLDKINTFRGTLDWRQKEDFILALSIYHKTHLVKQKITPTKMTLVMDLSVCQLI